MFKYFIAVVICFACLQFSFSNPQKVKIHTGKPAGHDTSKQVSVRKAASPVIKNRPDPEWIKKHPYYYDPRTKTCPFYFVRREGC